MEEAMAARYWCHMCSQMVNPIMEVEIKCPFCQSGFIEEMGNNGTRETPEADSDLGSDRALSLWAPILLGMMGNPRRRRRFRRIDFDDEDDENDNDDGGGDTRHRGLDAELESIIRRRRRSSATILQMLQGSHDSNQGGGQNQNGGGGPIGSLGDYFMGPGLDLLLQHLAENDPNRNGTPPAQKEVIETMPTVKVAENLQCSVCLDDFEIGTEAKEMPCKHKFHSECITPWLGLHSSCPVCRYQLPGDESKLDPERSRTSSTNQIETENSVQANVEESEGRTNGNASGNGNGNGGRFSIPWPFNGLFSSSGSNSTSTSSGSSSASPQANEN